MSTKDPNMKVIIGADTRDFDKGTKKVKEGLKDIGKESNTFGGALKALGSKGTAAFAAVGAAVAGTIAVVKNLSQQNQALGDAWGRTCAGMEAAFDSFKTAVANMDFTALFSNMSEASRLAQQLYDARDGLGEVGTSYNIQLARQQKLINQLKLDMADTSKSEEERVAAGNKLLDIYAKLEKNPTRALSRISDASLDVIANKLGYTLNGLPEAELKKTRRYVEQFFIWLGSEAGESWNNAYAAAVKNPALLYQTTVNAQDAGLNDAYRTMLWNYQKAVGEDDRQAMEEAVVAYYNQEAKLSGETLRIRKQIQSIQNSGASSDVAAAAKAAADAKKRREEAEREQLQLLSYMASRQELNDLNDVLRGGNTSLQGAVITPKLSIIPQTEVDEFKAWFSATFSDMTVYVGLKPEKTSVVNLTNEVNSMLETSLAKTGEIMGNLIGTLASGGDAWGDFKNAAVSALGDMAIAIGKIAIKSGVAMLGIQAALKLDNPYVAIAAGAALVALGAAVKSSLSAVASGDYSAGGGGYSGSYSSGSSGGDWDTREVTVNVTGTLTANGDQLVTVLNNTNKKNFYMM